MKKYLLLFVAVATLVGCSNFEKEAKPIYSDLKALYGLASRKCELLSSAWSIAIHEKKAIDGTYVSDFNKALMIFQEEIAIKNTDQEIRNRQSNIKETIKDLKDKKNGSYDTFINLYTNIIQLSELAINPNGSLQSYTNNINNLESEINKQITELEAKNPNFN